MKKFTQLALALMALAGISHAAPFLAIGDGAELFATGTLGVRADDNIFLSGKATSDTIFDVNPGLTLDFDHLALSRRDAPNMEGAAGEYLG